MEATGRQKLLLSGEVARVLQEDPRTVRRWSTLFADYLTCANESQRRRLFSEQDVRFLRRIHWMLREEGMTSDQALILLAEEREAGIHVELLDGDERVPEESVDVDREATPSGGNAMLRRQGWLPLRTSIPASWKQRISELQAELHCLQNAHADLLAQWEELHVQYVQMQQRTEWRQGFATDDGLLAAFREVGATGHFPLQRTDADMVVNLPPRHRARRSRNRIRRVHHSLLSWLVGLMG